MFELFNALAKEMRFGRFRKNDEEERRRSGRGKKREGGIFDFSSGVATRILLN